MCPTRFQHFVLTVDNRATDSTLPIVAKVRHSSCCLCSMHARWCFINIPGRELCIRYTIYSFSYSSSFVLHISGRWFCLFD